MQQSMLAYAEQLVAEASGLANNDNSQPAESPQREMQKSTFTPRIQRDLLELRAAERQQKESRRRRLGEAAADRRARLKREADAAQRSACKCEGGKVTRHVKIVDERDWKSSTKADPAADSRAGPDPPPHKPSQPANTSAPSPATSQTDGSARTVPKKPPALSVPLPRLASLKSTTSRTSEASSCSAPSKPIRTTPHPRGRWGPSPWTSVDVPAAAAPPVALPASPPKGLSTERKSAFGGQMKQRTSAPSNHLVLKHARVMTPSAWDTSLEHTHVQDLLDWHFANSGVVEPPPLRQSTVSSSCGPIATPSVVSSFAHEDELLVLQQLSCWTALDTVTGRAAPYLFESDPQGFAEPQVPFSQKWLTVRPLSAASQSGSEASTIPAAVPGPAPAAADGQEQPLAEHVDGIDAEAAATLEPPRPIPPAYFAPCWEGTVGVEQLREQRRLGWLAAPPVAPGALTAPPWQYPPLVRPRPPLRRSAGLGELSGDGGRRAMGEQPPRLQQLGYSTFRDIPPHSFATQSRPAASVRAAAGPAPQPSKPPLPHVRRNLPRRLAVCARPLAEDSQGHEVDGGRHTHAPDAWEGQERQEEDGSRFMPRQLEEELRWAAATRETAGPYFPVGAAARLQKRTMHDPAPTKLNLSHGLWGLSQIASLQEVLRRSPQLLELDVSHNGLPDRALHMLADAMFAPGCRLQRLCAAANHLSAAAVEVLLPHCRGDGGMGRVPRDGPAPAALHLLHVDLSGNPIGDHGVKLIAEEVCTGGGRCQLETLALDDCKLTERCGVYLEDMLLSTCTLSRLSLGWNNLAPRGAAALATGIESNISLKTLLVPWTGITDLGCCHIAEGLRQNGALRAVDLSGNNAGYPCCLVFAETLATNTTLDSLLLHHNPLSQEGIRSLTRAIIAAGSRPLRLALQHASFSKLTDAGQHAQHALKLDPVNPDGNYRFDLAHPAQRQVAIDLIKLAEQHGANTLRKGVLNGAAVNLEAARGTLLERFPVSGRLEVEFRSQRRPPETCVPLSAADFDAVWTRLVADAGAAVAATDGWKLELLDTLCLDHYFTVAHACSVLRSFDSPDAAEAAAVRLFSRVTDPEDWHTVLAGFAPQQAERVQERLGVVDVFNPKNPSGRYVLQLANQVHAMVATRLLELYRQQHSRGFCAWPRRRCFTECSLDGVDLQVKDPHKVTLPGRTGELVICFVDLSPVPATAVPMSRPRFAALRSIILNSRVLDVQQARGTLEDLSTTTYMTVLTQFENFSIATRPALPPPPSISLTSRSGPAVARAAADAAAADTPKYTAAAAAGSGEARPAVQDLHHFLPFMRIVSVRFFLTVPQLEALVMDLPDTPDPSQPNLLRVELIVMMFSRLVQRELELRGLLRRLDRETAVLTCARLGYGVVFDALSPTLAYRLRMWRADEHQVAYRLYKISLASGKDCIQYFAVDGDEKKVTQGQGVWTIMRGSAAQGETPQCTVDINFVHEDHSTELWAATVVQHAWLGWRERMAMLLLLHGFAVLDGRPDTLNRVRSWARSVKTLTTGTAEAPPPPLAAASAVAADDDLGDPLVSLCSNVQAYAAQLHKTNALEAAVARARRLRSVQAHALSLAQRLDLL
eukprot:jgi/Ulvmu1/2294/UM013_0141.1